MSQDENLMNEMRLFLEALPSDLGRGSLNGMRVQLLHKVCRNLQAAKPAETCNYPDCNCPFDAPADPSWCARGLQKQAAKPDDAPGSLPVVSEFRGDGMDCTCMARSSSECACDADWTSKEVYQLRAEIAKRDAEIAHTLQASREMEDALRQRISELREQMEGVDGLVEALRGMVTAYCGSNLNDEWRKYKAYKAANATLATYEAAQGEKGVAL